MTRQTVSRLCITIPVIMSAIAFGMIASALAFGWAQPRADGDEGGPARLFQMLIAGQLPFLAAYVATADWRKGHRAARRLALAMAALTAAIFPALYYGA